jgi:RNA polymerase sigma-70 factor (ECF subfamily)
MNNPMDPGEVRDLIEQALKGSQESFCELLRIYQGRVRGYLARYIDDKDVADDLAQETFLIGYRTLGDYRGNAPLGVWLIGIARNRALLFLRDDARKRLHESAPLQAAFEGWSAKDLEADQASIARRELELIALETCIKKLPQESASLVSGIYEKRTTARKLAHQLGKKEGTLRMMLLRIRGILRECIENSLKGLESSV